MNKLKNPVTGKFIAKDVFYIDNVGKEYYVEEVSDEHLKILCRFLALEADKSQFKFKNFYTKNKINLIYQEAYNRKLLPFYEILNLHSWALYNYGYCDKCPKLTPDYFLTLNKPTTKIYQVIFQDEYDNLINLGYYKNLEDSVEDINVYLFNYTNYKLKKEDLKEYAGTFSSCFDLNLNFLLESDEVEMYDLRVRGFIYNYKDLIEDLKGLE